MSRKESGVRGGARPGAGSGAGPRLALANDARGGGSGVATNQYESVGGAKTTLRSSSFLWTLSLTVRRKWDVRRRKMRKRERKDEE